MSIGKEVTNIELILKLWELANTPLFTILIIFWILGAVATHISRR